MKKRPIALLIAAAFLLSACSAPPAPAPAETAAPADEPSVAEASAPAPSRTPQPVSSEMGKLCFSEIMPKNRATLAAGDGGFHDWIELENLSAEPVSLDGWAISDGPDQRPWPLPSRTLAPGEYCLIFAAGEQASSEDMAPFALSADETLCLFAPSGALIDELFCPELQADEALARDPDEAAVRTV